MRFWTSANLDFDAETMSRLEVLSGQMRTCCEEDGAPPPAGGGELPPPGGWGPGPGGCGPGPGDGDGADRPDEPAPADCALKTRVMRLPSSSASAYLRGKISMDVSAEMISS